MKKTFFLLINLIIVVSTISAQKGINFNRIIAAGGKLQMSIDSSAKNVFYANMFANQSHTFFTYLPEVNNISIRINFRKNINIENYRYTILVDDKPIVLNKSIDLAQLKDTHAGGDEELFSSTTLGTFPIKGKIITILTYSIEKAQDIDKVVFYGKSIPRPKIEAFSKRFKTDKGVDYSWIREPKDRTKLTLTEKDDELTLVKDVSDIDYLYYTTIKDKQTNKIIFESTAWKYGGVISEDHKSMPCIVIDKNIFKKSGDYEIIIQPSIKWTNCRDCDISPKEIEKYTTRHTLSITLDQETFTRKELYSYAIIATLIIGINFLLIFQGIKRRNKKKLAEAAQQKNTAKLQLNSIRSQLNPHFLFNALAGIQNLMNKNEIDNANKYLSKFARLTRNVLDDKELISLAQEKTLLDDYLQMEQLRFGFKYEISSPENLANIEIPSMLLQPFVENAIKHGIAKKATDGQVTIAFAKQANDLELTVTDNGTGFDTSKKNNGLGIALSNSRIALLNSIYKENELVLVIKADENGTVITLILKQWL